MGGDEIASNWRSLLLLITSSPQSPDLQLDPGPFDTMHTEGVITSMQANSALNLAADLHYDILILIFQEFDLGLLIDRANCAQCALVCRAWSDPASRVLWRTFWYSTIPLCHILLPLSNASEAYNNPGESGLTEYYDKVRTSLATASLILSSQA